MTQIISVITKEYALLAADRQLTFGTGPKRGQLFDDETCKLVSLCNSCGIGYSGLACIEGSPTHEWIAKTLASANCRDPALASRVLAEHAGRALSKVHPPKLRRQIFLITGWAQFDNPPGFRSHFCFVTNMFDDAGQVLAEPRKSFHCKVHALHDNQDFRWTVIGQPLRKERAQRLERNLSQHSRRAIGPKEALRLLVDEIINTSVKEKCAGVGTKILGFCIPKRSVERQLQRGFSFAIAQQPNENAVAFTYFEPGYSELRQYGPTFICGESAATDIQTENDPARDFQSSQMRILALPKPKI